MTVLVKGMEMPGKCADCQFIDYFKGQWYCHIINDCLEAGMSKRDVRCPLTEVPTPHGRLIDADELFEKVPPGDIEHDIKISKTGAIADMCVLILSAPTVIEAEEAE